MRLNRRTALSWLGLGTMAPAVGQAAATVQSEVRFDHGVASGDPLADRIILWTRITPADAAAGPIPFSWVVTPTNGPKSAKLKGSGVVSADRDFTAKIDVGGLRPAQDYTYQFVCGGKMSPIGRFRTLPVGPVDDVVLAVASCSLYPNGYFNAYGAMSGLKRLDAVLHLGDYIYEYGASPSDYGMNSPVAAERAPDPTHEILSLADYRRRHAQYKTDPQLQAAHARAAWIVVWDDHESANDTWTGGAQNHNPEAGEGDWATRKAAAIRAYFEWMPIREPDSGRATDAIWRSFQFGDLISLIMVETRMSARSKQLTYKDDLKIIDGQPDVASFKAKLHDPNRRLMSPEQDAWLSDALQKSVASKTRWQVIGNQVLTAKVAAPDYAALLGEAKYNALASGITEPAFRDRMTRGAMLAKLGLPYNLDSWDGYPAARQRLYDLFKTSQATPIVLSGDTHNFWANTLHDGDKRVAAEICTTSITSPGAGDVMTTLPIAEGFVATNKDVQFTHQSAKGFALLTFGRTSAKAELMSVSTIHNRTFDTRVLKSVIITPAAGGGVEPIKVN